MDLRLYFRVIARFKYLVLAGVLLACVLTFFSIYRVSAHGISHRQAQTYMSEERLFLNTPGGVPYRSTTARIDPKTGQTVYPANLVPPSSLGSTSVLYSQIINSDIVQRIVGHVPGTYTAYTPTIGNTQTNLPFVAIDGFAESAHDAVYIANRVSNSFIRYVNENQRINKVPQQQRVILQVSTRATSASVKSGRHYTLPIIIFLVTLIATLGLAFILENLRPRPDAADGALGVPDSAIPPAAHRPEPHLAKAVSATDVVDNGSTEQPAATRDESSRASAGHETTRV
jgi:hypothetical protein